MSQNQLKSAKTDRPIKKDQKSAQNEQNCIKLTQNWLESTKMDSNGVKFEKKWAQKFLKLTKIN